MTFARMVVAACSIVTGFWLSGIGSSAVEEAHCAPSREAMLQPRWLHDAFDAAGIQASVKPERPEQSPKAPLRVIYDAFRDAVGTAPAEPTAAFLLARLVAQLIIAATVIACTVNGVRKLPSAVIGVLMASQLGVAVASGCAYAALYEDGANIWNAFALIVIASTGGLAFCALSVIAPLAGVGFAGVVVAERLYDGPEARDYQPSTGSVSQGQLTLALSQTVMRG